MRNRLYVESSVISYLTSRRSRDEITAAKQAITREWWESQRARFDLVASQLVLAEVSKGDADAARERREVVTELAFLEITERAEQLANQLVESGPLPNQARVDAAHIAVASIHAVDYLLTWNCKHIANAAMRSKIEDVCQSEGYKAPILCTPEELFS